MPQRSQWLCVWEKTICFKREINGKDLVLVLSLELSTGRWLPLQDPEAFIVYQVGEADAH